MKEIISLLNNNGPLEIIGGQLDAALLLNGELIQFTFLREVGTTWRYQIAKSIKESDLIEDQRFSEFVRNGRITSEPLSIQFRYILDKLGKGDYALDLVEYPTNIDIVEFNEETDNYHFVDMYGGLADVIETQAYYNEDVTLDYIIMLKNNIKPIVILLTIKDSLNTFILDGHHKFIAYSRLRQPARALLITKLQSKKIDKKIGLELFKTCGNQYVKYQERFLDLF